MTTTSLQARPDSEAPLATLRRQLEQRAEEFRMVLPAHITPEKLQRTILTAVQNNPDLLACDRRSFLVACMKAAQDGLLPDGREAAIVPFKTRVKDPQAGWMEARLAQYMPMVAGLHKKMRQSGEISDLFASVVYRQEIDAGRFVYREGSERGLWHEPIIDPEFRPSDEDIALAYSCAKFADGTLSFEVMRRWQIDEVREASQQGARFDAKGNPRDPKGPWVNWFGEMAKKTVLRRHSKSLPQSSDALPDVEAEDMGAAAARSTLALLESRKPDAPRQLAEPVDRNEEFIQRGIEAAQADAPAYQEPEITSQDPETEPQQEPPTPGKESETPPPEIETPEPPPEEVPPEVTEPEAEPEPEPDEYGVTKPPEYQAHERSAESIIARAKACELLMDLKALEREVEIDVAAMPEEIAACVDTEIAHARKRLTPPKPAKGA
jgi:recombination protein RecT